MTLLLEPRRKIKETSLAQEMPELNKVQIAKAMKKYAVSFVPKHRAFSILQNNIEDVVKKSTQIWKIIYGLDTVKEGEEEPIEVKYDEEDDDNKDIAEGDTKMKVDDRETTEVE